jgi:hypothetical protein
MRRMGWAGALASILVVAPDPGWAAETVELTFDWGDGFTVLRDSLREFPPPAPTAPDAAAAQPALPAQGTAPGPASPASPGPASAAVRRTDPAGWRHRTQVTRTPNGDYELRVIDFALRSGMGNIVLTDMPGNRGIVDSMAPSIRVGRDGRFAGLVDPAAQLAMLEKMSASTEERLKKLPEDQQRTAREAWAESRSLPYLENRAREPWLETVGFWVGRRLEIGRSYSETSEQLLAPLGKVAAPVRVDRQWQADGWIGCEEDTPPSPRRRPGAECVRLVLVSTFTSPNVPDAQFASEKNITQLESRLTLVTEPQGLRPRRAQVIRRSTVRRTGGAQESREMERGEARWNYGEEAKVALKTTLPGGESQMGSFAEPSNLKPAPVWAARSPEKLVEDFHAAWYGERADLDGTSLLHPQFIARAARSYRGSAGARSSGETLKRLVGDGVALETVDTMTDEALFRLVDLRRREGERTPSNVRMLRSRGVIGHVEDREARIHVVIQPEEFSFPAEMRSNSSTVVVVPVGEPCVADRDPYGCLRIWRHSPVEWEPISRATDR